MENSDIEEIIAKGQNDGKVLYRIVDLLQKIATAIEIIIGIMLLVVSVFVLENEGFGAFITVLIISAIFLALLRAGGLILTNTAKILVHTLFSNLAILAILQKEKK